MKKAYSNIMLKYMTCALCASSVMIICAAVLFVLDMRHIAAAELVLGIGTLLYAALIGSRHREAVAKYIKKIIADDTGLEVNALVSVPLAMAICSIDGSMRWYNELFADMYKGRKLYRTVLEDCVPELKWSEVLKNPSGKVITANIDGRLFSVHWRMIKDRMEPNRLGNHYSVFFYFIDVTREKHLSEAYENERVDIAVINIDNYDDFVQKSDDEAADAVLSKIRAAVAAWAKRADAVLKKTDRDKFFAAFEHQHLKAYIKSNFDIVEKIQAIAAEAKFPISISIGIGTGGSLCENETSARHALDLALGRGGGQVCIKDDTQFKFYGGRTVEYERSTRVKARAVASALADFIKESDNVIIMGHHNGDYDCFGAAVGLQRAVRRLGAVPYIVREATSPAIDHMYNELKNISEYNGMFVDENEVYDEVTPDTLLIVLDTHRPSMLPSRHLIDRISKIVVIDHHRRSTEFISPCSLVYHEPYASSTCEMVTELLEYMGAGDSVTKVEAQCLYTGIIMDTKNFTLKTGVRTFEAASYLRRLGLDTVAVRRMFSTSREDFAVRSELVNTAVLVTDNFAVTKTYKNHHNMRVIASQAADELLNIDNIAASVVVYPSEGGVGFSARSIGTINVQLIMEALGGGGHMTVSGAFIKNIDVDEGVRRVKDAVLSYLKSIEDTKK